MKADLTAGMGFSRPTHATDDMDASPASQASYHIQAAARALAGMLLLMMPVACCEPDAHTQWSARAHVAAAGTHAWREDLVELEELLRRWTSTSEPKTACTHS